MTDFIVDAMLGKVALWLRLAGYDTVYSPDIHDDELLELAKNASKVLLTSDLELYERAKNSNVESMLLRGSVDEKVADVFHKYKIDPMIDPSKSRCSKCNGRLTEISKEEKDIVKGLVFEQTFNHYDRFWLCDHCRSVFFQGGQWKNIENYMRRIKELVARRM